MEFDMKKELIAELFQKFENACYLLEGVECWSARELQEIFDYSEWRNFLKVIDKAKDSCKNSGESVPDHFVDINKMVVLGSGAERKIDDIALTRYACYLVAQNGDPAKPEVAFAQTYFAVQTRKQEIIEKDLHGHEKISEEHVDNNLAVRKILKERGVQPENLPPAEDVKKIERRLKGAEKKILNEVKKTKKKK